MNVNTNNLVSITEINQNFSRVARLIDENGAAVILKNNVTKYMLLNFSQFQTKELTASGDVKKIGKCLIKKNAMPLRCWRNEAAVSGVY